jgi:hypothetical protein
MSSVATISRLDPDLIRLVLWRLQACRQRDVETRPELQRGHSEVVPLTVV